MKKLTTIFSVLMLVAAMVSCTKSGALTGGSAGNGSSSFGSSINGSVTGGLSAVSGATINLMVAGSNTPLGTATTASDGSFNLVFTNPGGNSLLYLQVTGGNAGGGTNSNSQFVTIVGTTGSFQPTQRVNELTTAAAQLAGYNMGILTDMNGTVALAAPGTTVGANNVVTQFNNLISTSSGALNTSNSHLLSTTQTGLSAMGDDFASCIEVPAKCSTLFNTAQSSSSSAASNLLESGYNALTNSAALASPLYTLGFPMNSNTGFSLTSSSVPGGFTFNNLLAVTVNTFSAGGTNPTGVAIDASGNIWVPNANSNNVTKYNSSGTALGTFSTGANTGPVAIDASGNVWLPINSALIELNSSGTLLGSFALSITSNVSTKGVAIDQSGNIWVDDAGSLQEFNSAGTTLGTFSTGSTQTGDKTSVAIDSQGNIWGGTCANPGLPGRLSELNSSGTVIANFTPSPDINGCIYEIAFDPSGNLWIAQTGHPVLAKMTPGGVVLSSNGGIQTTPLALAIDSFGNVMASRSSARINVISSSSATLLTTYTSSAGLNGGTMQGIAIDASGNVWVSSSNNVVQELVQAATGTEFFPYSGQPFPRSY